MIDSKTAPAGEHVMPLRELYATVDRTVARVQRRRAMRDSERAMTLAKLEQQRAALWFALALVEAADREASR